MIFFLGYFVELAETLTLKIKKRQFFFYVLQLNSSQLLISVTSKNERESVYLRGYKHMQ